MFENASQLFVKHECSMYTHRMRAGLGHEQVLVAARQHVFTDKAGS